MVQFFHKSTACFVLGQAIKPGLWGPEAATEFEGGTMMMMMKTSRASRVRRSRTNLVFKCVCTEHGECHFRERANRCFFFSVQIQ